MNKSALVTSFVLLVTLQGRAEMDSSNRVLLIQKLQRVQSNLAPQDPSKVAVTLRLADLYADQARVDAMKDLDSGCVQCTAGTADRKKALALYLEVLDRTPDSQKGKVMIQVGHLYEMTGQEKQAIEFYSKILKNDSSDVISAEASLSLAEIYFKKGQWALAKASYSQVLKSAVASSKGLAAYHSALCEYHLGDIKGVTQALIKVLKTPEYLSKSGTQGQQIDVNFQEEVSRDLATFMGRGGGSLTDFHLVYELSPENARMTHSVLLAQEFERAGMKKESLAAWYFVFEKQSKPEERVETLAHTFSLNLELGDKKTAEKDLKSLFTTVSTVTLKENSETQRILKQAIVNWNKVEKATPSEDLLQSYELYSEYFSKDIEMAQWGAQVAKNLKMYPRALALEERALQPLLTKGPEKELENALLAHLETAELSNDQKMMEDVRNFYLSKSTLKTKSFEVTYQKAKALYDQGQYQVASTQLKEIALNSKGAMKLRTQAADLALDALVLLKNDSQIQIWADDFVAAFPAAESKEYSKISQKNILNQVATLSKADQNAAWTLLLKFNLKMADDKDIVTYYKNKILLSEKRHDFNSGMSAAQDLLNIKGLSTEEADFANGRLAFFAEMKLDFKTSLAATQKLGPSVMKAEDKFLKLAMLADLSGTSSTQYFDQFLKTSSDKDAKMMAALEVVHRSAQPMKELEAQKKYFEGQNETFAAEKFKYIWKTQDFKMMKKASAEPVFQKTAAGAQLNKVLMIQDIKDMRTLVQGMKLDSKNQKALGASIKARSNQLEKLDQLAQKAIESKDWTAQLMALDMVAKESKRFYEELLSLPLPAGLKPEEENEYMNLLGQQAAPYNMKSEQAQSKVNEFWGASQWKPDLQAAAKTPAVDASLFNFELNEIKALARTEDVQFLLSLNSTLNKAEVKKPTVQEIEMAKTQLRNLPMDKQAVVNLMDLEKQMENQSMVQYLQGRLKLLESGGVQ